MRRMHTKEEIFELVKQSPTAAKLAEDLANIVAFDRNEATENGRVPTQMIGGDWGVKKEDIPEQDGVYRTAYGIFVKTHTGQYSYKVIALYKNNFYIQDRDNTTETNFLFVDANLLVKPVYWHTVKIQRGGVPEETGVSRIYGYLIILNNSSEPFTLSEFKNMLRTPSISIVLHSGLYSSDGGEDLRNMNPCSRLVYLNDNRFNAIFIDPSTHLEIAGGSMTIENGWMVFEDLGANRIN